MKLRLCAAALVLAVSGCKKPPRPPPGPPGPVVKMPDGLQYQRLGEGEGNEAKAGDRVEVHYTGTLDNGTVFDSSRARNQPFRFRLGQGQVIRGWDEGIAGMKPGERRTLTIPPDLGYGSRGSGPIPPNSTLHFDVELMDVN